MASDKKNASSEHIPVTFMLESILGCKWSISVLSAIRDGVHRPSDLERHCEGISAKVLNERLRKLSRFGIIIREVHPTSPPKVEYRFTDFGRAFLPVLDSVSKLQSQVDGSTGDKLPPAE